MIKQGKDLKILLGGKEVTAKTLTMTPYASTGDGFNALGEMLSMTVNHYSNFCNLCGPTNEETFEAVGTGLNVAGDEIKEDFAVCANCVEALEKEN